MKALLLAAGMGTRLKPITDSIPKCLVPILGKPLLEYWLDMLAKSEIRDILINLHYLPDKVRHYIKQSRYHNLVETVYEEKLLGTAGTLLKNERFFGENPVMLVHADNLSHFDIQAFIEKHNNRPAFCPITMMTFVSPTPQSCGIVELNDQGIIHSFHEKVADPPGNLANGAVYIIEPSIFSFLRDLKKEIIDFSTEVLPHFIGRIYTFHNNIYHRDIGTPENYQKAQIEFRDLLEQKTSQVEST